MFIYTHTGSILSPSFLPETVREIERERERERERETRRGEGRE